MSTNYPTSIDDFTNPTSTDTLNSATVPHAAQHANANDAIEALQAKVGIDGSAVTTSLDYRVDAIETPIADLNSALSITKTGNWLFEPSLIRVPSFNAQASGVTVNCQGKCGFVWSYSEVIGFVGGVSTLVFNDATGFHNGFNFTNCSSLTSLSFPVLKYAGGWAVTQSPYCTTIDLPELEINNGQLSLIGLTGLTTLNIPKLKYVGGLITNSTYNLSSLASLSMPLCEYWGGNFTITNGLLTTISLPNLKVMFGNFVPHTLSTTTLDLSSLEYTLGTFNPVSCLGLTTISLPSIISMYKGVTIGSGPLTNLTTFTLGPNLKSVCDYAGSTFQLQGTALTQASVDDILVKLSLLDGTNGTTLLSGKTINLDGGTAATPSATGLAAKAILVAAGNTVTHN